MDISFWPEIWWLDCSGEFNEATDPDTWEWIYFVPVAPSFSSFVSAVCKTSHWSFMGQQNHRTSSYLRKHKFSRILQEMQAFSYYRSSGVMKAWKATQFLPSLQLPKEGHVVSHNQMFPRWTVMTILPKYLSSQALKFFCRNWMKSLKRANLKETTWRHGETTTSHKELVTGLTKAYSGCDFLGMWFRLYSYSDLSPWLFTMSLNVMPST